jgi:transcriptional regulator with XRE-family HTH domain
MQWKNAPMSEETIGRALKTRRAFLGLDQRDAATRIGMSRTTYSSYERDTQRPSVDVLPAIADFLEVSIDNVLLLFGASAIAAARTALGRLSTSTSAPPPRTDTDINTSDVITSPDPITTADEYGDSYARDNGESRLSDVADSSPYRPAVSIDTKIEPHAKVHDEREKGKKKKKKKGKREKLVIPEFATHV